MNQQRCLNFGCGKTRFSSGKITKWDNLDLKDFDFNKFPYPIKSNTYDYIYSRQVLEHLDNPEQVLKELHRISKPNAIIEISVPHFNSAGAFEMLGHKSYFGENTFKCLTDWNEDWRNNKQQWEIIEMKLIPTEFGKGIFKPCRKKLSLIIRGIYKEIQVKMRVIK